MVSKESATNTETEVDHLTKYLLIAITCLSGCGPDNFSNLQDNSTSELTEETFRETVSFFRETYTPIMHQAGGQFRIQAEWRDNRHAAWSAISGNQWRMWLFGGMARHPALTLDGYKAVICHEIGHFLGGEPRTAQGVSAEAQADYYAAESCLPYIWHEDPSTNAPATDRNPTLPQAIVDRCNDAWSDDSRAQICQRSLRAGWTTLNMNASIREIEAPNFLTPDTQEASATILGYPSLQCRLDTFVAGATGMPRPHCWFVD
jgi:hypothetical protein